MLFAIINLIKKNPLLFIFIFIALVLTVILMLQNALNKELALTSISPNTQTVSTSNSREPFYFCFAEKPDKKTIDIMVNPQTKVFFEVQNEGNSYCIKIAPNPWWRYNFQYTITIDKKLTSVTGAKLKEDIIHSFQIIPPPPENYPVIP